MNKRKIRWIIALMTPALIGIIGLQVYWIQHDLAIKQKQLEQNVRQAMSVIVDRIETTEAFNSINSHFFNFDSVSYDLFGNADTLHYERDSTLISEPSPPPLLEDPEGGFDFRIVGPGSSQMIITLQKNKHGIFERHHYTYGSKRDSIKHMMFVETNTMKGRLSKMQEAMGEMMRAMMQRRGSFYQHIDEANLGRIVNDELSKRGIDLKYQYAIASGTNDSLIVANKGADTASLAGSKYRMGLLPNDIYSRPDYLVMSFSGITTRLLSALWPMLLASLLFTLTVVLGFSYSINTIIRQKKLSDIKNDFINNMTHEFKTPIATISLAADAMNNPKVYENRERLNYYTHIISEENKRMNVQVENVLKMAQFEKGEITLKPEAVNINSIITRVVDSMMIQVEKREGKIACQLEADRPCIEADPVHVANIITNLVDNANKYSTDCPDIIVRSRSDAEGVIINIIDHGIGMTKETIKKIFEKFYRVQSGNIHDIKGFGLGLSYVKAIVEQHKGTVNVASEPGKGSNFEIFLPYGVES